MPESCGRRGMPNLSSGMSRLDGLKPVLCAVIARVADRPKHSMIRPQFPSDKIVLLVTRICTIERACNHHQSCRQCSNVNASICRM
ncbi:hypothetical protein EJ05DRAFT_239820 [Pseudovirgaria hyperparasitica]|uniref:Uncharacterized protein n=1 Tax=Pseudovirgaria hyperparasitica TaxID=470096 RepID=A0A6A6WFL1_9PEZI|nr:uncharacterized protein EJ05DRAFT_239820 [Pseudovirgaria hyperparasitica]KAF2760686.1 hypothetical protein EJ05DRAFT_239820 [Pseudovirgaria hyperparasitica]